MTEHRAAVHDCPACRRRTRAAFPEGVVSPAQYGERVKAAAVYLNAQQLVPEERTAQILQDLFGAAAACGASVARWVRRKAEALAPVWRGIGACVAAAPVRCLDETGFRIAGADPLAAHRLDPDPHVLSRRRAPLGRARIRGRRRGPRPLARLLRPRKRPSRLLQRPSPARASGGQRTRQGALGRGPARDASGRQRGRASGQGAGRLGAPPRRPSRRSRTGTGPPSGKASPCTGACRPSIPRRSPKKRKKQRPAHNLLIRFKTFKDATLRFLTDFTVPFTNNLAEQDLRMMKVKIKISGGFRTLQGAADFASLRSVISSARKQGLDILKALTSPPTDWPSNSSLLNRPDPRSEPRLRLPSTPTRHERRRRPDMASPVGGLANTPAGCYASKQLKSHDFLKRDAETGAKEPPAN